MNTFETGKTYSTRSISNSDCVFSITILKRTAKSVTFKDILGNGIKRAMVFEYEGSECVMPTGRYSMAPTIRAL